MASKIKHMNDIVIKASQKHTATVIFLHGLGDTGYGWSSQFKSMTLPYIKYVFPTAHTIPVTLNAGFKMPSWFDLYGLTPNNKEDEMGIKEATYLVHDMIEKEKDNGISSERIIIGGFSQGGALALYTAFTYKEKLAGIIALSAWLPLHKTFPDVVVGNKDTPIFQAHGRSDNVINYSFGVMTKEEISKINPNVKLHTYQDLGHCSDDNEMQDVKEFIEKVLPRRD